jgi:hypothetical protein
MYHRESFYVILYDTRIFTMGVLHEGRVEVKCTLTNLKNNQQHFYDEECVLSA